MQKLLKYLVLQLFLVQGMTCFSQTIGTIQNDSLSLQGYTFFSPFSGTKAYLVNNCGRLVNVWDRGTRPGLAAYFLETGLMLRTYKPTPVGPFTSASNSGGIELVDWDNNTVWSYELNTPTQISHHDAVYMPNGNILMLTWELEYSVDLIAWGRDPNEIAVEGYMWSERIIEIEPVGTNQVNTVWEWYIKDHYIQDFDSSKLYYGVIADHQELFNINLPELNSPNSNSTRDWNHFNSIDYHPGHDQILISTRNSDEIWILDHSTTTLEAAGHSGGRYGMGGDILYRWGNASAYDRAPVNDQKLFGQHGVNWIKEGLADEGKIMIYNNGNGRPGTDYSTIEVISPPIDTNGNYIASPGAPFAPENPSWIYGDGIGADFYSTYLSNAQRLPNGNTLINAGSPGNIFEIDEMKNIVWEYEIPLNGDLPGNQGANINNNSNFRAYKYAADFTGFSGIELIAGPPIESGTDTNDCKIYEAPPVNVGIDQLSPVGPLNIFPDVQHATLRLESSANEDVFIELFELNGRRVMQYKLKAGDQSIQLPELPNNLYLIRIIFSNGAVQGSKVFISQNNN